MWNSTFKTKSFDEIAKARRIKDDKNRANILKNGMTTFYTNPRKALRKHSTAPTARLERALWAIFSLFVKIRDGWRCFLCGKRSVGSGMHAGHFIEDAVGGVALRYHEMNVHAECSFCNLYREGHKEAYEKKMLETYGEEAVQKLKDLKNTTIYGFDYKTQTAYYKEQVSNMKLHGPLSFNESIGY
ncbi:MAG: recombination protein NinG [Patescibacteria group bacterium]